MHLSYNNLYYEHFSRKSYASLPVFRPGINYMMRFVSPLKNYLYLNNSLTVVYIREGRGDLVWKNGSQKKVKIKNNRFVVLNADCGWDFVNHSDAYLDIIGFVISKQLQQQFNFYVTALERELLDYPFEEVGGDFFYIENTLNADHYRTGQLLKNFHQNSLSNSFYTLSPEEMALEMFRELYKETAHIVALSTQVKAKKRTTQMETIKRLTVAKEYIHDNLMDPICLDDISRVSALSKHHIYDSFKRVYGRTPHQYVNYLKIHKSKAYLQNGKYTVNEVSDLMGFSDYSVFSKLFKKINGIAPSNYN